jgi:hypothetical protein
MLAVIAHGEDAFRLVDATGRDVGWVRPKTVGFTGFVSENAAQSAALDGARALVRCLKREFGVTHLELSDEPRARTIRDGDGEWVGDGQVRVARLLRVENGGGFGREFAIEFRLPPYANHAVAISAAQIAYGALSRELTGTSGSSAVRAAYNAAG